MIGYLDDLLNRRAQEPHDDLASLLAAGHNPGPEREDLVANSLYFILAGHATTTTIRCGCLELLLTDPKSLYPLEQAPTGADAAIKEILRQVSPINLDRRHRDRGRNRVPAPHARWRPAHGVLRHRQP
jgi:pimeloyl-[acyl-carrier protein] synthase